MLPAYVTRALRFQTGHIRGDGCLDFASYCWMRNQKFLRLICPSQCRCDDPLGGLYYNGPNMGCPRDRCKQSALYTLKLSELTCVPVPFIPAPVSLGSWPPPRKEIGVRDPRTGYFGPWVRVADWAWTPEEPSSRPRRRRRRHPRGVMLENPIIENPITSRSVGTKTGLNWPQADNGEHELGPKRKIIHIGSFST